MRRRAENFKGHIDAPDELREAEAELARALCAAPPVPEASVAPQILTDAVLQAMLDRSDVAYAQAGAVSVVRAVSPS